MKAIAAGGNPVLVKRGIDLAVGALVEHLSTRGAPGATPRRTSRGSPRSRPTTTTSIGRDRRAGPAHRRRRRRRHRRGRRRCSACRVDFVEDFEFDNGYVSPYMVTDPGSMLEAVLDDPYILLFTAEKITDVQLADAGARQDHAGDPRPLVIVAEKVEGTALQMLVHNHVNGTFQVVAIQAPGLRREARAPAGGHGRAVRRQGAQQGARRSRWSRSTIEHLGRATQVRVDQRQHHDHRRRRRPRARSSCGSSQLRAELARATIGTDEDCARRAHRAAVGQGGDHPGRARRPTPSSRRSATASTTRCRPPGPRWPRASSRAAARRCCTPSPRWTRCEVDGDYRDRRRDRARPR